MSGRDRQPARAPAAGPGARWTSGLLFGAAGVIGFSGTVPATRVAAPVFGPVTLTFARIVIAAVLGAVMCCMTVCLRSQPARSQTTPPPASHNPAPHRVTRPGTPA
jgi:hypothetical protein